MHETSVPTVFDILANSRNLAADDVLLEALNDLEPDYGVQALDTLLARQQSHALTRLIDRYDRLPADCQALLSERIEKLEGALRTALRSDEERSRLNAIDLVLRRRSYALSYLLGMGLHCASSATRATAACALRDLAAHLCSRYEGARYTPSQLIKPERSYQDFVKLRGDRAMLAATLRDALTSYDSHLRMPVVEATATLSLELEDDILAQARKLRSKYWRAVLESLKYAPDPKLAGVVLQALKVKDARSRIADLLGGCQDNEFMQAVMGSSWLLGDGSIRAGCKRIRRLDWLAANQARLLEMSAGTFRQTVRFLGATSIDDAQKLEWYRSILESHQDAKQLDALVGVAAIEGQSAREVLRTVLDWAGPELCRLAARSLSARDNGDASNPPARYRSSSTVPSGQSLGTVERCEQFDDYWTGYDGMTEAVRQAVGRRLLMHYSDFVDALANKLENPDAAERVRALNIVRSLRLADRFQEQILQSALDSDRFVRSAAVRTLSQIRSSISKRLLSAALADNDHRVRANAVEALDEIQPPDRLAKLAPALQDDHHRVRAAAIKALLKLRVRDAAETLLLMLRDSSRAHKISALWVVEKYGLARILSQVSEMVQDDPDETVRKRARRLLRSEKHRSRRQTPPIPAPRQEHEA